MVSASLISRKSSAREDQTVLNIRERAGRRKQEPVLVRGKGLSSVPNQLGREIKDLSHDARTLILVVSIPSVLPKKPGGNINSGHFPVSTLHPMDGIR